MAKNDSILVYWKRWVNEILILEKKSHSMIDSRKTGTWHRSFVAFMEWIWLKFLQKKNNKRSKMVSKQNFLNIVVTLISLFNGISWGRINFWLNSGFTLFYRKRNISCKWWRLNNFNLSWCYFTACSERLWIGGTDLGDKQANYFWVASGWELGDGFTNWDFHEPNNGYPYPSGREHCTEMNASGKWNDQDCLIELYFLCQTT